MADSTEQHPADTINMALLRASSLLSTVSFCFDNVDGEFVLDKRFVANSITAVMKLVDSASEALERLNSDCDLTLLAKIDNSGSDQLPEHLPSEIDFATVMQLSRENANSESSSIQQISSSDDVRAQTYEQLLQKVTAAEVFATAESNSSDRGESMLIPILNSLKQDLLRMKSVA